MILCTDDILSSLWLRIEVCVREREREDPLTYYADAYIKPRFSRSFVILLLYLYNSRSLEIWRALSRVSVSLGGRHGPGVFFFFRPTPKSIVNIHTHTRTHGTHDTADRNVFNFPGRASRRPCNVQLLDGVRRRRRPFINEGIIPRLLSR